MSAEVWFLASPSALAARVREALGALGVRPLQTLERAKGEPSTGCVVAVHEPPSLDGLGWLGARRPPAAVVLVSAAPSLEEASRAVALGVEAYLGPGTAPEDLRFVVRRALARREALETTPAVVTTAPDPEAVVGRSPAIVRLFGSVARAAASSAPVLIRGETGVGKEWVARAIHRYSARSAGPFVAVNCSALPEGTLESELFGHARGGFTGALESRKGLFQTAHGGTVFLDEMGDLAPRVQAELLRVLQEGEVRSVGSDLSVKVDLRVLCATNRDVDGQVHAGQLREDLLFRLRVLELEVPALRDRREDIALLAQHFLALAPAPHPSASRRFAPEALAVLERRAWPGNVRELRATVARAAALSPGPVLLPQDLEDDGPTASPEEALWRGLLRDQAPTLEDLGRRYAQAVLRHRSGNKTHAAQTLGVDRKTLRRLLGDER